MPSRRRDLPRHAPTAGGDHNEHPARRHDARPLLLRCIRTSSCVRTSRVPDPYWGVQYSLELLEQGATVPPLGLVTVAALLPRAPQMRVVDMKRRAARRRGAPLGRCKAKRGESSVVRAIESASASYMTAGLLARTVPEREALGCRSPHQAALLLPPVQHQPTRGSGGGITAPPTPTEVEQQYLDRAPRRGNREIPLRSASRGSEFALSPLARHHRFEQ